MLDRVRIVLVNTSHPGNIGSVARAMKTMGLVKLYLVSPLAFPHPKALEMASGAVDILGEATVVSSLQQAIANCTLVVGASARERAIPWPLLTPAAVANKIKNEPPESEVALIFGREHSGLSNEELRCCHIHTQIPANPEYSSLNLAAAVQVLAYELRMTTLQGLTFSATEWDCRHATANEMEMFFSIYKKF